MFAATKQSLPQYEGCQKKVVTGHGVDIDFWHRPNSCQDEKQLLMVHRLSRSKRVEIGIKTLALLPREYTLTIYGRPIDREYFEELQNLVTELKLKDRVTFAGPLPMPELRAIYPQYRIMINMASETIDKTMLEAMCNGVFPVTTPDNSQAIGLLDAPAKDATEEVASFVLKAEIERYTDEQLLAIVRDRHSLTQLVAKMAEYIKIGN
jgi:glycosyltransferase involved in cell wall biosynthesis